MTQIQAAFGKEGQAGTAKYDLYTVYLRKCLLSSSDFVKKKVTAPMIQSWFDRFENFKPLCCLPFSYEEKTRNAAVFLLATV